MTNRHTIVLSNYFHNFESFMIKCHNFINLKYYKLTLIINFRMYMLTQAVKRTFKNWLIRHKRNGAFTKPLHLIIRVMQNHITPTHAALWHIIRYLCKMMCNWEILWWIMMFTRKCIREIREWLWIFKSRHKKYS